MNNSSEAKNGWQVFCQKAALVWKYVCQVFEGIGHVFMLIADYVVRLHKIIMAVPVALAAIWIARYSQQNLPESVGINLQPNGEYAQYISQDLAVIGPLLVTLGCLVLMFCSRRTVYPWIISIFSLALPLLILLTNVFPG